jgi:hypothetical protein
MLSYNHFQKNKLKYVIVCIFLILTLVLIRCYCNNKERFSNTEGFANEMITDVLLGKKFDNKEGNRISLSDNIKESNKNELNIIYSTYYIQPITDDTDNTINIFLRTNVVNTTKIIGDLCFKINSKKLALDNNNDIILNNENVPHLLNPILQNENALELTKSDIKINEKTEDEDIIELTNFDYDVDTDYTTLLINLIGINDINDIYFDDNMKKIYNFFEKGKTDADFLGKNDTQILNDLTYETNTDDDLFKIIKNVKYIEELRVYFNEIVNKTFNFKTQVSIILSNRLKNEINKLNKDGYSKRIYAGYNISNFDFSIPFTMEEGDNTVRIDNNNKFKFKNNVLKQLKYNKPDNAKEINILINYYEIFIDEIILFKDTILETKFSIPYLETTSDYRTGKNAKYTNKGYRQTLKYDANEIENVASITTTGLSPETININSNSLISTLENNYSVLEDTNPTKLKDEDFNYKVTEFKDKLDYILNKSDFFLKLPLEIIRMKDPKDDDTHVIFGDIIDTYNIINTENNILSNYVKIPRRCCFKTEQYYGDGNNTVVKSITKGDGTVYNLYQHPIYKTFKVFSTDEMKKEIKYIYQIEPCAPNVSLYENNIKAYNTLKGTCKNIKTSNNENKIKDNSFNQLQIRTKLNTINKNKANLDTLKKQISKLQNELDRKDIIKSNYNRVKLQKHNEHKQDQIYEARRRLNKKDSVGINITYPQEVIDHLLEIYKNKYMLNPEEQDKYNKIYNKLLEFDNKSGNKEFNAFIAKKMKEDKIDIVRLLPDTNSKEFKDKYFKKILLQFLTSDNTDIK